MIIQIDSLQIGLHRTVQVKNDDLSRLPPSLGYFETYNVSDFPNSPENWDKDALFIPIHDKEALWLSFSDNEFPNALLITLDGINVLNGTESEKLEDGNYLVTPPQPWLDGWKSEDGTVFQFVTTKENSVAEQLGKNKKTGLKIQLFEAKNNENFLNTIEKPSELVYGSCYNGYGTVQMCGMAGGGFEELGIGKGGEIRQKIYADPYGLETWKETSKESKTIYFTNAKQFSEITGLPMSPLPRTFKDYYEQWYDVDDDHLINEPGTLLFKKLKSVS